MITYISDIIPKIQKFSQKIENLNLLMNHIWVEINDIDNKKVVYIFRKNNELLISENGLVMKAKWELLGNNSLLIDQKGKSYLFKHGFFDENILALKIDSSNEYALFVNESKFNIELNSSTNVIDFLVKMYITPSIKNNNIIQSNQYSYTPKDIELKEKHFPPKHLMIKKDESYSLFGTIVENFIIKFEDGLKEEIFIEDKNKQVYFKAKINGKWVKSKIRYESIDSCIVALHYFLKTGEIYKNHFISIT
jgi:hypothetical protein